MKNKINGGATAGSMEVAKGKDGKQQTQSQGGVWCVFVTPDGLVNENAGYLYVI